MGIDSHFTMLHCALSLVLPSSRPRVCAVSFLNTVPLVWGMLHGSERGIFDLSFSVPSECADRVASGEADLGILPVAEIQRLALPYFREVGIASRGPVRGFLSSMSWLAVSLMLLIAGATAAVVLLAARAGLDTHRDTIEVLHMLGSTDVQIARLFQRRIAFDTLLGGLAGTAAALVLVWFLQGRLSAVGSEMLGGVALQRHDWFLLLLLPLSFALLATVAARIAVLRNLGRRL